MQRPSQRKAQIKSSTKVSGPSLSGVLVTATDARHVRRDHAESLDSRI